MREKLTVLANVDDEGHAQQNQGYGFDYFRNYMKNRCESGECYIGSHTYHLFSNVKGFFSATPVPESLK